MDGLHRLCLRAITEEPVIIMKKPVIIMKKPVIIMKRPSICLAIGIKFQLNRLTFWDSRITTMHIYYDFMTK